MNLKRGGGGLSECTIYIPVFCLSYRGIDLYLVLSLEYCVLDLLLDPEVGGVELEVGSHWRGRGRNMGHRHWRQLRYLP